MSFTTTWHNLLENIEELPSNATFITPLSNEAFQITDGQEHQVLIQYNDDKTIPLQKDQFETLYRRIRDLNGAFELDRLPPDAEPYATVLSLHPRFAIDECEATITESDQSTGSPLVKAQETTDDADQEREEPDIDVYADALLLIDSKMTQRFQLS